MRSTQIVVAGLIAALHGALGCMRVPAEIATPTQAPAPAPAKAAVDVDRPLSCDGTLTAILGDHGLGMAAFEDLYVLEQRSYESRRRAIPKTSDARYHRTLSERVIYHEILALEAAKLGLELDAEAVAEREREQRRGIDDWPKHLLRRGESDESLRAVIVAEQRELAILDDAGLLTVTDEEILAEYEATKSATSADVPRIRAAHVLIMIDDDTSEADALARAEAAYQLAIVANADFAKIAREHSDGATAERDGDLGLFTADRMVAEFSNAAFALAPGQVSAPVRSKFGYHVIKVYEVWGPGELPLEALEPEIRERLRARKLRSGRLELKNRLFAEYAPVNCIEALALQRGLEWKPD